jgi:subtilisin-like proprotein convertase family protein
MATPTDPLYSSQWHFNLIGDIETIWNDYTGSGINIGIYDTGVQATHADLNDNYNSALAVVDGSGNVIDQSPSLTGSSAHGTAVAGIIAAELNGSGTVGIAYGSSITGVNILNPGTTGYVNYTTPAEEQAFFNVIDQAGSFDIMTNSWGGVPSYNLSENQNFVGGFDYLYLQELEQNMIQGRGGLGTIVLQAAGNDGIDANGSGTNSSRFTITVAATDINGNAASYTNVGSAVLITAPAAAYTTDLIGNDGYNAVGTSEATGPDPLSDTNFTSTFGGTSAATPVVAGVVALMLEANPNLGWRDVQNILAISASHTGSAIGAAATGFEQGAWEINGANNWNGGGMSFNGSYGFGMVDAFAAVRMAEVWSIIYDAPLTSTNEQTGTTATTSLGAGLAIPTNGTEVTFSISSTVNISIEHIQLNLNFQHAYIGDVEIFLTDPDGNKIQLVFDSLQPTVFNGSWSYGINSFLGAQSAGTWTVSVVDTFPDADDGTLFSGSLEFFGTAISTDDVYQFTADFLAYATADITRATISDTNGGIDWLNFAAISDAVSVSLLSGSTFYVGGISWGNLSAGLDVIENAITGDGNDTITGNSLANELFGMRGDDTLYGGGGNDTLVGGAGTDKLFGGTGTDTLVGGTGNDIIIGGTRFDTVDYSADAQGVTIIGSSATGAGIGNDSLFQIENFLGGAGNDAITGNSVRNTLTGNDGNDTLDGGAGNDILFGGTGTDTLVGGTGNDIIIGGTGFDTVDYSADAQGVTIIGSSATGAGIGNDSLFQIENFLGGAGNDAITGNSVRNTLTGNDGNDTLDGGAGDDILFGGAGSDVFVFVTGSDNDRIADFTTTDDMIDLSAFGFADFTALLAVINDVASGAEIALGAFDSVILEGVFEASLTSSDFIL